MKKLFFIFLFSSTLVNSQNLVPNWSFETYTACPTSSSDLPKATPWFGPTSNSADYFNICATPYSYGVPYQSPVSFQYSKDGSGFAGIYLLNGFGLNYREYIQVKLNDSLANGFCYYVEFFTNLLNASKFATNNVAANFSNLPYPTTFTSASTATALNVAQHITNYSNKIIKDTLNWVKVSGIYSGTGIEKFITIGNFKVDSNTDTLRANPSAGNGAAYYYIDAVSVYSINPTGSLPWTYTDTSLALGDSVYIGNTMGGTFTSNWYAYGGTFINSGSGIYVKPVTTSTYVVQFTVCGVPRSDTLKVTVTGVGVEELRIKSEELRIMPNPNSGVFEVEILTSELRIKDEELRVTNVLGQEIKREKLLSKIQKINLEEFESGIYYLHIVSKGTTVSTKKIIKL